MRLRTIIAAAFAAAVTLSAGAQETAFTTDENHHTDFIGYSTRPLGESRDTARERYILPLRLEGESVNDGKRCYDYTLDMSVGMLERQSVLRISGARQGHSVSVNGIDMGHATDSSTESEFNITEALRDGKNTIRVTVDGQTSVLEDGQKRPGSDIGSIYVYAHPRLRIYDCLISALPDSLGKNGLLDLGVILKSDYNYPETVRIGYDVYGPDGKMREYSLADYEIPGNSTDTVRISAVIGNAGKDLWSAENPSLYTLTLYVRRNLMISEYIRFEFGFGQTTYSDGRILRNGKAIDIRPVAFEPGGDRQKCLRDLRAIRKEGHNTVYLSRPQPSWFYEQCSSAGLYVVDQANIHARENASDRRIGGTPSNDPRMLDEYLGRTSSMYYRHRMYPCVIAWSLAGQSGNGYNLYKTYQWLRSTGDSRPAVYRYADGEWNSDITLPEAAATR